MRPHFRLQSPSDCISMPKESTGAVREKWELRRRKVSLRRSQPAWSQSGNLYPGVIMRDPRKVFGSGTEGPGSIKDGPTSIACTGQAQAQVPARMRIRNHFDRCGQLLTGNRGENCRGYTFEDGVICMQT
ncbi:hypothetical protein CMUS01_11583 [Colletotrichum musicola]|uniref:Uncharacterized protein n=1 Tax=Colletotrichum musicola TaxID=2175873 RepID=A0A8H6JX12_9PEZI|nr:hypothetical protein CMUS01_11583 [Colletotrichum musicola]